MNLTQHPEKGLSFIDVVVGVALMTLVFVAISGVFKLSIELIGNNKARIGAVALANEQIELLRSLSYDNVGTQGGIPSGNVLQTENITLNNVSYTRRTLIQYVDDPKDGSGDADMNGLTSDYKRAKVEITWNLRGEEKKAFLVTNIVPKGIETVAGGGTLIINVFNAAGSPVLGANVHIENTSLNPQVSIDISTNTGGQVIFPGSPAANEYEIIVTKNTYSSSQTYGITTGNPNPSPRHMSVIAGETTVASFAIDIVAQKTINTFSPIGPAVWTDPFNDLTNTAVSSGVAISGGALELAYSGGYTSPGLVQSVDITDTALQSWSDMSWNDTTSASTTITYKLYYKYISSAVALVPDNDLPGNSTGFTVSPVDISALSVGTYTTLRLDATLTTIDASTTPSILDWSISYTAGPTPLPNMDFNMRGDKTIGTDGGGAPIYKYSQSLQTDSTGNVTVTGLEWDNYTITLDVLDGYDISESCTPQPRSINPSAVDTANLTFVPGTANSLLVDVKDDNGVLLENASVRLYRLPYDSTQSTSACGQTHFSGLAKGTIAGGDAYNVDVTLIGYSPTNLTDVEVDRVSTINVVLGP